MKMKMKKIILLMLVLVVFSCRKETIPTNMHVTANYNQKNWEAKSFASALPYGRIGFSFKISEGGTLKESLGMSFLPLIIGSYDSTFFLTDSLFRASYVIWGADGDAILDYYLLDKSVGTNFFSIDKLSTTTKELEGRFDLTFFIDTNGIKLDPNAPDIIHFTDGSYKVLYK